MSKIVIIGSGIGGLSAACLLAKAGHSVTVFEKNSEFGGRAGHFTKDGFTFPHGPTWYLMPEVFEKFFDAMEEKLSDHIELKRLNPSFKVFWPESFLKPLEIHSESGKDGETFERLEPGAKEKLHKYILSCQKSYDLVLNQFIYENYSSKLDLLKPKNISPALKLNMLSKIQKDLNEYFQNEQIKQILGYSAVFVGASPYSAPSPYKMLNHAVFSRGVFYPKGGMYSITSALINLAKQHQVDLCSNSEAVKIQKENGKTIGVKLQSGQEITADVVIDNAYIGSKRKKRLIKESPSAVLIYIGINGKLPKLKTHNLFFAPNWPAQFKHLQKSKILPRNPSFYVHTLESDLAPKDKTGLFVIVPVPNQARPDKTAVNKLVDRIIEAVAVSSENPELRKQIILRKILGPDDFISRYGSSSMLGPSHTFWQTGPFRPQNKSKKVKGLYFAGANTVPGVGVPMCLISGQLVAERIMSDLKG